jgi:hypothetical protein
MALTATLTQQLRARYEGKLDKYERRLPTTAALTLFKEQTTNPDSIISMDLMEKARTSFGNDNGLAVPVINGEDVTIGNAISCTCPGDENTSALVNITFIPYSFCITMNPAEYNQNDIKYQEDFNAKMKKYLIKLRNVIDAQCVATIEGAKNTYWTPEVSTAFGFTQSGDALQLPEAEAGDLFNRMTGVAHTMDYWERQEVLTNPNGMTRVYRYENNGSTPAQNDPGNLGYQFGNYNFWESNNVIDGAGVRNTYYSINTDSLGLLSRNIPEAIAGERSTDGTEWGIEQLPIVDLPFSYVYKSTCTDLSSISGGTSAASLQQSGYSTLSLLLLQHTFRILRQCTHLS